MKWTYRVRQLLGLRDTAPERRPAVDRFINLHHPQNDFAVCGRLDRDRYDINQVIEDHREGTGKLAFNVEYLTRFPCALLVASRHSGRASRMEDR